MQCPGGECVVGENGESTCVCRVGQFFNESAAECTRELYCACRSVFNYFIHTIYEHKSVFSSLYVE